MDIPKLLQDRTCGFTKIILTRTYGNDLGAAVSALGLPVSPADLQSMTPVEAQTALSRLFSRDLAYGKEVMGAETAQAYARAIITEYARPGSHIYTNAQWEDESLSTFTPVTPSTFNVVVLITNTDFAVSFLIEDED